MNSISFNLATKLLIEANRLEIMFDYEAKELVPIGLSEILTNQIKSTK